MSFAASPQLFDMHPVAMLLLDPATRIVVDANASAVRFYGWTRKELLGKPLSEIDTMSPGEIATEMLRAAAGESHFHSQHRLANGEERHVEVHSGPIDLEGRHLLHAIVIDETPRVRAESALRRRDRLYAMLSQTTQRLVRARDRADLLEEVCRVAVDHGAFRFAWVGWVDAEGKVQPVARAGQDSGYIDSIRASIHPGDPRSRGPAGRSILTGKPAVIDDFQNDTTVAPWREHASVARVKSAAAIPLFEDAKVVGALLLYSGERGFFADEEVATLSEMASDVSYGLYTLASAAQRVAAEERAAKWYGRLERYLDGSPSISYASVVTSAGWHTEWVTPNAERLLGYSMQEMLADGWWEKHVHPDDLEAVLASNRTIRTTGSTREEYRFLTVAGTELWVLDTARFEADAAGSGDGGRIYGTWTDISDRRRAAEELRESEERLRLALSSARQGLYDLNVRTGVAVVTAEYATMLGYDPATFRETNAAWRARMHPDDVGPVSAVYDAYVAGTIPEYRVEFRQRMRTGEWRWILSVGRVVRWDAEGQPTRMLGTHTDITDLKRTEEKLAQRARTSQVLLGLREVSSGVSEREFFQSGVNVIARLTESEIGFMYLVDQEESALEHAFCAHSGASAQCLGASGARCDVSEAGSWADALRRRCVVLRNDDLRWEDQRGLAIGHLPLRRFVSIPVIENGAVKLLVGVGDKPTGYDETDVETVQLLAEELWRLAQQRRTDLVHQRGERLRELLLENLAEGVVAADASGRLTIFNRVAREWHGVEADASLDETQWTERYRLFEVDGTTPLATERIPLVRAIHGETVRDAMISIVLPDAPARVMVANGGPLVDDDGRQVGAIMVMHDQTAQRRAEAALLLRGTALEAAADAIVLTNRDGVVEWANPAFTTLTGYTVDEAAGKNPRALLRSGVQSREFYAEMWQTILSGRVWRGELVNKRRDGTLYPESLTITPVRDEAGEIQHFIAMKRDLTEDRSLRENLLQAQKMESVGRLAGGVAHDFNNLLTVINGSTELALGHLTAGTPSHDHLLEIRRAAERAAALTRQLLAFSRRQILRRQLINLPHLIGDLSKMLQRLIGEDVTLITELPSTLNRVLADAGQLEQVVMNLVVNARDAMPKGGTLTLTTADVELDHQATAQHADMVPGHYVRFSVRDTGVGMDERVKARIFEPFFTTKAAGQGTGLGLSTVYGIIRQSGGDVHVESASGVGTVFHLYLPYATEDAEEASVVAAAVMAVSERAAEGKLRGTVLVVDDEPILRDIAMKILTRAGYTTMGAGNAEEAMTLFAEHGENVDLLLTDVVMPGLSGPDLASALTAQQPKLKVIFSSGYTDDTVLRHGVDGATMTFLGKPYSFQELIARVEATLAT